MYGWNLQIWLGKGFVSMRRLLKCAVASDRVWLSWGEWSWQDIEIQLPTCWLTLLKLAWSVLAWEIWLLLSLQLRLHRSWFPWQPAPDMPSKATLFNLKCEPVFDFGTGPRNHCYYNPQGNNILVFVLFVVYDLVFTVFSCLHSLVCSSQPITHCYYNPPSEKQYPGFCSVWL